MKKLGLCVAICSFMLALPAVAADEQQPASSGGVVSWVLSAFDSTPSAPAVKDDQSQSSSGKTETAPIDMSGSVDSDKDSYKPDAGDAPH
jgi:hypothetical protein